MIILIPGLVLAGLVFIFGKRKTQAEDFVNPIPLTNKTKIEPIGADKIQNAGTPISFWDLHLKDEMRLWKLYRKSNMLYMGTRSDPKNKRQKTIIYYDSRDRKVKYFGDYIGGGII